MDLQGTRTERNIKEAFAGESQARNHYTYYAMQARKEGHHEVAALFEQMAENEMEHAKVWFKVLNGGLGDTQRNLKEAALKENLEWKNLYPKFGREAREEGFEELALLFEKIASIENNHERKFIEALLTLFNHSTTEQGKPESGSGLEPEPLTPESQYRCKYCGNLENERLGLCPICESKDSFEIIS